MVVEQWAPPTSQRTGARTILLYEVQPYSRPRNPKVRKYEALDERVVTGPGWRFRAV